MRPANEKERLLAERAGLIICQSCGGYLEEQPVFSETDPLKYKCTECNKEYTISQYSHLK